MNRLGSNGPRIGNRGLTGKALMRADVGEERWTNRWDRMRPHTSRCRVRDEGKMGSHPPRRRRCNIGNNSTRDGKDDKDKAFS